MFGRQDSVFLLSSCATQVLVVSRFFQRSEMAFPRPKVVRNDPVVCKQETITDESSASETNRMVPLLLVFPFLFAILKGCDVESLGVLLDGSSLR
jgi:hypothetical protein